MGIYGIDVSKHQGTISWDKVKNAGKSFAFIRLGWAGYNGQIVNNGGLDPTFKTNVEGALAAGIDVGIYLFSYVLTPEAAKVAAKETLELLEPYKGKLTYPIAFDIEDNDSVTYSKKTKAENTAICEAFLSTIEQAGYYAQLYTYKSFMESSLDMDTLKKYDVWVAQYASKCSYSGNYGIWQYAGDIPGFVGSCDGISTAVDLDISYVDYPSIIKAKGLNGFEASPEEVLEELEEKAEQERDCIQCAVYRETIEKIRELVNN